VLPETHLCNGAHRAEKIKSKMTFGGGRRKRKENVAGIANIAKVKFLKQSSSSDWTETTSR